MERRIKEFFGFIHYICKILMIVDPDLDPGATFDLVDPDPKHWLYSLHL
jgi:hypothetical protein